MNGVIKIAKRFLPPYKNYIILNLIFNVLNALLNVFSFALIIPILQILFKASPETYDFIAWDTTSISMIAKTASVIVSMFSTIPSIKADRISRPALGASTLIAP